MDDQRNEFTVRAVRTNGVNRAVPLATFVVGLLVGAAFVKPWDLIAPPATVSATSQPASTAAAAAEPSPSLSPSPSPAPAECAFAGGWRVFALGIPDPLGGDGSSGQAVGSEAPSAFSDIGNPLRRWLEVDPLASASGPADTRIPFVTIVSDRIAGIGYCPPPDASDPPPADASFEAWTVAGSGRPAPMRLRRIGAEVAGAVMVAVFIAADPPRSGKPRWDPGRYVFAVRSEPGGYGRWFGVEIRTPPARLTQ